MTYNNNQLVVDGNILKLPHLVLLAIYKGKIINFRIVTDSFYYVKIKSYKDGFTEKYAVNYGSEDDELVTPKPYSAKKIIFK